MGRVPGYCFMVWFLGGQALETVKVLRAALGTCFIVVTRSLAIAS